MINEKRLSIIVIAHIVKMRDIAYFQTVISLLSDNIGENPGAYHLFSTVRYTQDGGYDGS